MTSPPRPGEGPGRLGYTPGMAGAHCSLPALYRRTLGGEFRWCAQWWHHGEAISRLTALWYAWEAMRLQGVISPRVEARLDEMLGHPETCPHGNPIDAATASPARRGRWRSP